MKLIKDYDCIIDYHPGKANVVADALSRKALVSLRAMNADLQMTQDNVLVAELKAKPSLLQQIQEKQKFDEKFAAIREQISQGKKTEFSVRDDGFLYFGDRICVPNDEELKRIILTEAHSSPYAMHPGSTKMY